MTVERSHAISEGASFVRRVAIVLLMAALAYALWRLTDLVVLTFGAVLFSLGLQSATGPSRAGRGRQTRSR